MGTNNEKLKKCPFCNINQEEIITESDYFFVIDDRYPVTEGHKLLITKQHIANCFELDALHLKDLWMLANKVRKDLLSKDDSINGFNFGCNAGKTAGQTIFHVHWHLIPRRRGDSKDPTGGIRGVIPEKQKY